MSRVTLTYVQHNALREAAMDGVIRSNSKITVNVLVARGLARRSGKQAIITPAGRRAIHNAIIDRNSASRPPGVEDADYRAYVLQWSKAAAAERTCPRCARPIREAAPTPQEIREAAAAIRQEQRSQHEQS